MVSRLILLFGICFIFASCSRPELSLSEAPQKKEPFELDSIRSIQDMHLHALSPQLMQVMQMVRPNFEFQSNDAQYFLNMMDQHRVRRGVFISAGYLVPNELPGFPAEVLKNLAVGENTWTAAQAASSEGRLLGFCGINIAWEYALEEARRCLGELGLKGIKMHFQFHDTNVAEYEEKLSALYGILAEFGVPALIHPPFAERGHNWLLFQLSLRHPNTVVMWAHALSDDVRTIERYAGYYKNWPGERNLFLGLSHTLSTYKGSPVQPYLLWLMKEFGTDYLLFGSDESFVSNMVDQETYREKMASTAYFGFGRQDVLKIMNKNFDRVFEMAARLKKD